MDAAAAGILDLDPDSGLLARAIVPATSPVILTVRLTHQHDIALQIPVIAHDALPEVALNLPARIKTGSSLVLNAAATDDVGIAEVRFLMDGEVIGFRRVEPYEVTMEITDNLANQSFTFSAVAVDTAGQ